MKPTETPSLDPDVMLAKVAEGKTTADCQKNQVVFSQGDQADAIFYIQKGKIKLTVVSRRGKEAVIAILGPGDFFGEECLAGRPQRMSTAGAMGACSLVRLAKVSTVRMLHSEPAFAHMLLHHQLSRTIRIEEDLIDQLFNSSEKRLARVLLLLAHFGKDGKPDAVIPKISQETLAEKVGTTRSRVSFFMNKFRKRGFIEYRKDGLEVHTSLLNMVLHD
jgi:CRP-like cAMP-binding protein